MLTKLDSSLFIDIADAIGLGNPAIVEKDYYVVQLLQLFATLTFETHEIIFSGGTALAKSTIKTFRMSEDVDLKLVPKPHQATLSSNAKRKNRKAIKQHIEAIIKHSNIFSLEEPPTVLNEYRYFCFDIKYPQKHKKAPCLRPYIKLEFIESPLLTYPESRSIQSIYSEIQNYPPEIVSMSCASIINTQAEKMLSILRRTASITRNNERDDDKALIRHIYDTYRIQTTTPSEINTLAKLIMLAVNIDMQRYGNQHPEFIESPINELRYGLQLLERETRYVERYEAYVTPMVYSDTCVSWVDAFSVFKVLAESVLDCITNEKIGGDYNKLVSAIHQLV